MKDYLLTILTFAATVMVSAAIPFGFYSGGQRNIADPESLQQSEGSTIDTAQNCFLGSSTTYVASLFQASSSYTCTRIDLWLQRVGTPGGNVTCYIYSDDGASGPNALLATSTNTIDPSTFGTSYSWQTFNFSGQTITNTTQYHIVITSGSTSGTAYVQWGCTNAEGHIENSSDGSTWSFFATRKGRADIYGS